MKAELPVLEYSKQIRTAPTECFPRDLTPSTLPHFPFAIPNHWNQLPKYFTHTDPLEDKLVNVHSWPVTKAPPGRSRDVDSLSLSLFGSRHLEIFREKPHAHPSPVASIVSSNKRGPSFPLSSPSFPLLRKRQYVRSKPLGLFPGKCTRSSIGLRSGWRHPKYYPRRETWRFRLWRRWFTRLVGRARSASFYSCLKYNYLSLTNVYSSLVQFCGFGYGITSNKPSSLFLLCELELIGT